MREMAAEEKLDFPVVLEDDAAEHIAATACGDASADTGADTTADTAAVETEETEN